MDMFWIQSNYATNKDQEGHILELSWAYPEIKMR